MRLLILITTLSINCMPIGIGVGSEVIERAKAYIQTNQPEWHVGHCEMQNRYWCNNGKNQCCGGCGGKCD